MTQTHHPYLHSSGCFFHSFVEGFSDDDDNASSCTTLSRAQSARSRSSSASVSTKKLTQTSSNKASKPNNIRQSTSAGSLRQTNNWVKSGNKEDSDLKPALVQSLFPYVSPTIYFAGEGEKGMKVICLLIIIIVCHSH